jgi:hypothetical protein
MATVKTLQTGIFPDLCPSGKVVKAHKPSFCHLMRANNLLIVTSPNLGGIGQLWSGIE